MDFENEESKIIVAGTCYDMCPEIERKKRENENDIHKLELPLFYLDVLQLDNQEELTLKHTMIKKFQRSSADHELQIAEMLRTPETLLQTIQYIEDYVMSLVDRNIDLHQGDSVTVNLFVYLFIWDRYRMIAKDFTLQQSALELTPMWIECHERMARWFIYQDHAMKSQSDFVSGHAQQNGEQLNNLLKSLQTFYQNAHHRFHDPNTLPNNQIYTSQDYLAHESEFIAYFILFQIGNAGEITKFLQKLSTTLLQTKEIKFAIEVWSSILTDNYAKFFHLLRHKSNILQACLMHRYVGRMRLNGLRKLSRSFPPSKNSKASIHIQYFTKLFCFEEDEQTISFFEHCGFHFKLNDDQQMVVEIETITLEDYMPQDKNGHPIYPIVPHLTYIIDANKRMKDDDGHLYSIQDICRGFATMVEPVTSTLSTIDNTTNSVINGRGTSPTPSMNTPLPASSGTQSNSMLKANKDKWLIPKKKVVDPSSDRSALLSGSLSSSREPVKPPSPKVKQSPQTKHQPLQSTQQQPATIQFQAKETAVPAATTPQQPFKSQASSNDTNKSFAFSPPAPPAANQPKITNPFAASNPQSNQFNSFSAKDAFPSLPQAPVPSSNNQSWKTPTNNKQEIPAVTPMNFPSYQSTPAAGPFSSTKQTPGQSLPFSPPNNNWMSTPGTTTATPITPGTALTPSTFNTFSSSSLQIQPPVEDSPVSKGFDASYQPTKQQGRLSDQFHSKQTPYKPRTPQFASPETTKTPSRSYHESPRSAFKDTSTSIPTNSSMASHSTPSNQPTSQSKPRKQLATKDIKRLKTFIQGRQRKLTQFFLQNAFEMWKIWILKTENNGKTLILKNSMKKWKIIYKFMKIQRHKFLESMKDINTIPATPLPIPLVSSEIQCKQILENNRNLKASNQGIPSFYYPLDYIPSSELLFNIPIPDPFPVDFPQRDILLISSSQEKGYYHVQHDCPLISTLRHLLTSASGNQLPMPLSLSEQPFQPLYQCQQRINSEPNTTLDYELNIYETTFKTLETISTTSFTGIQSILLFNSNFQQFFSNQSNPLLPKTLTTSGKNIPIYVINVFYYEVEINEKISIEHFSQFPTLTLTSLPESGPLTTLQTFLQSISTSLTPQMNIVGSSLILIPIMKQLKDLWKTQFTLHRHVSIPLSQYHLMDSDMNQILQSDLQYSMSFVWTTIPSFPLIHKVSLLDWVSWHILSYYGHISSVNSSVIITNQSNHNLNNQQIITYFHSFQQMLCIFQQTQIESQLSYLQQLQQYFPIGLQSYSTKETSSSLSFPFNEQMSLKHSLSYIHHMCTKLIEKLQSILSITDSFSMLWFETNWKQIWQSLLNEIVLSSIPKEMKEEEFVRYSFVWSYCYEFNWELITLYSNCQQITEFIQSFEAKLCIFLQYYLTLCISKGSIEQWLIFPKLSMTSEVYDGDMLPPSPLSPVPMPSFVHLKKQKEQALLEDDSYDQYDLIDDKMKRRRLNEPLLLTSFSSFASSPHGKKTFSPLLPSTIKKQRFMNEEIDGMDMNYLPQTPMTSSQRSANKTNTTNTPQSSLRSLFVLTNPEEDSDLPEEEEEESSLNSLDQFTQLLQSIQQEKQRIKQNIQSYQQTLYDYLK